MDCFDKYYIMFGDTFPSWQLGLDEYICNRCLEECKDVYELGYLDLDDNTKYWVPNSKILLYI